MKTISCLEEQLLKKEIAALNAELVKAMDMIGKAFDKYGLCYHSQKGARQIPGDSHQAVSELNEYLDKLKLCTSTYYAGDWLRPKEIKVSEVNPPEWLVKIMREKVCKEFLQRVEELQNMANLQ